MTITVRALGFGRPPWNWVFDRLARDNYLARIKLETGVFLHSHLALFGGVSLNQLWTDGHLRLIESGSRYEQGVGGWTFRVAGVFLRPAIRALGEGRLHEEDLSGLLVCQSHHECESFPKSPATATVTMSPRLTLVKFRHGLDPSECVGFLGLV